MSSCAHPSIECRSTAIDDAWAEENCPQQSAEAKAEFVAASLCAVHTQQRFGADITHRGKPILPPPLAPVDGTRDRGR